MDKPQTTNDLLLEIKKHLQIIILFLGAILGWVISHV